VEYLICGQETGEKGTPHLQGFVHFKQKLRFKQVKELLGNEAHIEKAKGTNQQNRTYCSKSGHFQEWGTCGGQGKRSDLKDAAELLRGSGGNLELVATEHPDVFIRYGRGLRDYCSVMKLVPPRSEKTMVYVLVGPPGCGKSKWACENTLDPFYKMRGEWWDGYQGQTDVIMDDFYGWMKYDELLRLTDRYPHKVPIKGSYVEFVAKKIVITSNKNVEDWYPNLPDTSALFRRINVYYVWNGDEFVENNDTVHPINF
jgi:hypothetical protein